MGSRALFERTISSYTIPIVGSAARPCLKVTIDKQVFTCLSTAGEGGPWGMALLAAYRAEKEDGETLEAFLARRAFASAKGSTLAPTATGKTGFDAWLARYRGLLEAEKAAVAAL